MVASVAEEVLKEHGVSGMDIYIRMNEDNEKDYCFQADPTKPVSQLFAIFEVLPMVLSPSFFYHLQPVGFSASTHPGFLTSEGGLLFENDAHKLKHTRVLSLDKPLGDQVLEGQLIVPIWEFHNQRWLTIVSLLGAWLYLDLPDCISPTPGLAPMTLFVNGIDKLLDYLAIYLNNGKAPVNADGGGFDALNTFGWQMGFFAFHLIKVAIVYLVIWSGGVNPASGNPLVARKLKQKSVTRESLLAIGWTGSRRSPPFEWREENRKLLIERHGGIVKAYHAGVLQKLGDLGVELGPGEGFDSSKGGVKYVKAPTEEGKFVPDVEYYEELHKALLDQVSKIEALHKLEDGEEDADVDLDGAEALLKNTLKRFRRIGPIQGTPKLIERYQARKALEPEKKK